MATDSKQQSASEKETLPEVQVGSNEQVKTSRTLHMPKKSRKNLLLILLALLVIAVICIFIGRSFHIGQKVYAQAAGHKIYKQDIDSLIGTTKGVNDHQAAVVLANKYLTEAMAKKAGITVTNQDLVAQYPDINTQKVHNKFAYQGNVNTVYFNKLQAYNSGLYQGKLLVANFSRHIAFQSPFLALQEASDPLMGNAAAIAADKTYAHNFITKLYNQVKNHQITFDQAIQKEHNDPTVGLKAYQTLPHSGPFNTSNVYLGATALIVPKSIQPQISSMKGGQLSAPFTVSVNNSLNDKNSTTESYYLVVQMNSTSGGHSGLSYDQYLAQSKKQLGYKVYV